VLQSGVESGRTNPAVRQSAVVFPTPTSPRNAIGWSSRIRYLAASRRDPRCISILRARSGRVLNAFEFVQLAQLLFCLPQGIDLRHFGSGPWQDNPLRFEVVKVGSGSSVSNASRNAFTSEPLGTMSPFSIREMRL